MAVIRGAHSGDSDPPARPAMPRFYRHELETGDVYVVQKGERILGFVSVLTRQSVRYVAELFVRPGRQSRKVGGLLLREALPEDGTAACTLSSRDYRAMSLYIRAGMRSMWPNFELRVRSADLGMLPELGVEVTAASPGEPDLVTWDEQVGRRRRPLDLSYLTSELGAVPLWFRPSATFF
ncbi:MAG: GNAT family N-acetyltransferase [Ignavibacteriales bacterium]